MRCPVRILAEHGYKIIEARDGAHELELLEPCDDVVHLLVSNYDMPRLNGVELARRFRRKHVRLMVLISGQTPDADPSEDIEVLPKPYNRAVLSAKVRELLKRRAS